MSIQILISKSRCRLQPLLLILLLLPTACTRDPSPARDPQTDIRRFLTQSTFGVTEGDVKSVATLGYDKWLDAQFAVPVSDSWVSYMNARNSQLQADPRGGFRVGVNQFYEHFYRSAATAEDQLRQRAAFALSQIFVISIQNDIFSTHPLQVASYYDMLEKNAFGNYRTLLEDVALQPGMGFYLSTIWNLPDDPATGRVPDENFAREIMQLMSIGLTQLDPDGSPVVDGHGQAIPTFSNADVEGLARVFTGFGWYAPNPTEQTFWNGVGDVSDTHPMTLYPGFHSTMEKRFLGTTLGPVLTPDPSGDLKAALDAIFNHPNVGPFLARRLIQELVTSNPSPAYVGRVASVFNNNGQGVRGDLQGVFKAILMDPEARDLATAMTPGFGKLREPVLRFTQWMRAFAASSQSGFFLLRNTDEALSQSPLNADSVFNFWSPNFSPNLAPFHGSGLVAPEFQLVDAVSVATYLNFMKMVVDQGCGGGLSSSPATNGPDISSAYTEEMAVAADSSALVDRMDLLLLCGTMSDELRSQVLAAVDSYPVPTGGNAQAVDQAEQERVRLAALLVLASPEFLHQR